MALEFSPETYKKFEETVNRYPKKEAAMLPVLCLAQREFGHLGEEAIAYVAKIMDQPPARVHGVVSFYTMLNMKPIGKNHRFHQAKARHRGWPHDSRWKVHPLGGRMFGLLRHSTDDADRRRLLREPDGREGDGDTRGAQIATKDGRPRTVIGLPSCIFFADQDGKDFIAQYRCSGPAYADGL